MVLSGLWDVVQTQFPQRSFTNQIKCWPSCKYYKHTAPKTKLCAWSPHQKQRKRGTNAVKKEMSHKHEQMWRWQQTVQAGSKKLKPVYGITANCAWGGNKKMKPCVPPGGDTPECGTERCQVPLGCAATEAKQQQISIYQHTWSCATTTTYGQHWRLGGLKLC